jgi:hypothetical protein
MHIAIINDCRDDNAAIRQLVRAASLTGASVSFCGVGDYGDLGAAGNLIDTLDAFGEKDGAVLVNVAPRHHDKEWKNGTPFCYALYKKVRIVASYDGYTLSLLKKLKLVDSVELLDIPEATEAMVLNGALPALERERIINSQFRSFDFVPRVAAYLTAYGTLPAIRTPLSTVPDAPRAVWWVDNFGNAKTTLLPEDIGFSDGGEYITRFGTLPCIANLARVPKGTVALTIGSSGYGTQRFLEVAVSGGRADERFAIHPGIEVL